MPVVFINVEAPTLSQIAWSASAFWHRSSPCCLATPIDKRQYSGGMGVQTSNNDFSIYDIMHICCVFFCLMTSKGVRSWLYYKYLVSCAIQCRCDPSIETRTNGLRRAPWRSKSSCETTGRMETRASKNWGAVQWPDMHTSPLQSTIRESYVWWSLVCRKSIDQQQW